MFNSADRIYQFEEPNERSRGINIDITHNWEKWLQNEWDQNSMLKSVLK